MEIKDQQDLEDAIAVLRGMLKEKLNNGKVINYDVVLPKIDWEINENPDYTETYKIIDIKRGAIIFEL